MAYRAGCENPAMATHASVKGGGSNLGRKTWSPGAVKTGYTTKSVPAYVASPGPLNGMGSGMSKKQSVKGKR